jgi:hypothetical protein
MTSPSPWLVLWPLPTSARELGVDVPQSVISITQHSFNGGWLWRVNYGPKDYIGRRGGDLIIEVDPSDARIENVLWGQ